jgi:hypothetical protein
MLWGFNRVVKLPIIFAFWFWWQMVKGHSSKESSKHLKCNKESNSSRKDVTFGKDTTNNTVTNSDHVRLACLTYLWLGKFHHIIADIVEKSQGVGHKTRLWVPPKLILEDITKSNQISLWKYCKITYFRGDFIFRDFAKVQISTGFIFKIASIIKKFYRVNRVRWLVRYYQGLCEALCLHYTPMVLTAPNIPSKWEGCFSMT